jgi:hypothetical protein
VAAAVETAAVETTNEQQQQQQQQQQQRIEGDASAPEVFAALDSPSHVKAAQEALKEDAQHIHQRLEEAHKTELAHTKTTQEEKIDQESERIFGEDIGRRIRILEEEKKKARQDQAAVAEAAEHNRKILKEEEEGEEEQRRRQRELEAKASLEQPQSGQEPRRETAKETEERRRIAGRLLEGETHRQNEQPHKEVPPQKAAKAERQQEKNTIKAAERVLLLQEQERLDQQRFEEEEEEEERVLLEAANRKRKQTEEEHLLEEWERHEHVLEEDRKEREAEMEIRRIEADREFSRREEARLRKMSADSLLKLEQQQLQLQLQQIQQQQLQLQQQQQLLLQQLQQLQQQQQLLQQQQPLAATSLLSDPSTPRTRIRFSFHYETTWGQKLLIVGSIPELGMWNPFRAVQARWLEGNYWEAIVEVPAPSAFEYKYVLVSTIGPDNDENQGFTIQRWEERNNVVMYVPPAIDGDELFVWRHWNS